MTAFFSTLSRLISAANSALRRSSKSGTVSDSNRFNFAYISSVASILIATICIHKLQTHIKDLRRMRQSADGNVIHSRAGYFEHIFQRYVARGFEFRSPRSNLYSLAHQLERHIIEQNPLDSERQRLANIIERSRFDFDLYLQACFANSRHRRGDRTGEVDMVVLYQDHVEKARTMVLTAAEPHCEFVSET